MDAASSPQPPSTLTSAAPFAPAPSTPFAPTDANQRIEALDVVRGFALFGIFLMNIEWFNRPFATFDEGIPRDATGLDRIAGFFVAYFVQGKFWTIFSLLFGMGFAVMLVRAERAGRPFVKTYLRRILALAVFGAVHFIFIWHGDILFSYAVGALGLMIVLYGRGKPILIACAVLVGLGMIPGADLFFRVASGVAMMGLFALFLRGRKRVAWRGASWPVFGVLLLVAGTLMSVAAVVFWLLPDGPREPRWPLSVMGPLLIAVAWLSTKTPEPFDQRIVRLAVGIYVFGGLVGTLFGAVQLFAPDPGLAPPSTAEVAAAAPTGTGAQPQVERDAKPGAAPDAKPAAKAPKTPAERAAEVRAEREKQLAERAADKTEEVATFTGRSYPAIVAFEARKFPEKAANDAGFAVVLVAMFLLGTWFVRTGVMTDPAKHLPFFRKLALYGLPLGIGLGLLTALVGVSHTPGDRTDGWGLTRGLVMLGNLPACLGYVGLVVTLLHSETGWSRIRVLAPAGRMALTNYLMQSLICMAVFYGIGLGQWGMPRAEQVLFVVVVYAAQIAASHWWLARFRYGPMEWVWRGFTYRQVPPLRIADRTPASRRTA